MTTALQLPDTVKLKSESTDIVEAAHALMVKDATSYAAAAQSIQSIKALRRKIDLAFDDLISNAHKQHVALIARKREFDQPLADAEDLLKSRGTVYLDEEERKRMAEEQRIAKELSERQAAEDAKARAAVELARAEKIAEAQRLEQGEFHALAEQVLAEAAAIEDPPEIARELPVVSVASRVPKLAGVTTPRKWSAVIVDLKALAKSIGAGEQPTALMIGIEQRNGVLTSPALNAQAVSLKAELRIPGVKAVPKTNMTVKGA